MNQDLQDLTAFWGLKAMRAGWEAGLELGGGEEQDFGGFGGEGG